MKSKFQHLGLILFKDIIRDKIFIIGSLFAIIIICISFILGAFLVGQSFKFSKDLGLLFFDFAPLLIITIFGIDLLKRDLNRKGLCFLLSKPVSRDAYLIGVYVALILSLFLIVFFFFFALFIMFIVHNEIWIFELLVAGYLAMLKGALLFSFSIFLAITFPSMMAKIFCILVFLLGYSVQVITQIADGLSQSFFKYSIIFLQAILPNFEFFNKKSEVIYSKPIPLIFFANATIYTLSYAILFILISIFIFKKKRI